MSTVLTKGLYMNNDLGLVYVGSWGTFTKNELKMVFSATKGDNLQFSFLGTGFKWYTQTNAWRGLAKVYLDGVERATVDTYSTDEAMNVVGYSIDNLSMINHTVKIEVLAQGNVKAIEYKVVIDKIEILQQDNTEEYKKELEEKQVTLEEKQNELKENLSKQQQLKNEIQVIEQNICYLRNPNGSTLIKGIYKNNDSNLKYTGNWGTFIKNGLTMVYSSTKGDSVELSFLGTGVKWYTQTNAWRGLAKIYLDGIEKATVDTYSTDEAMDVIGYSIDSLSMESHTVKIEVLAQGNLKSIEYKVVVSKIEILQNINTEVYEGIESEKKLELQQLIDKQQQLTNQIAILQDDINKLNDLISGNVEQPQVIPVTNLIFETESVELNAGETYQLKWTVEPSNASNKTVNFQSGNTGFVTVSENGLLTYINEGETNVSAKISNNIIIYVRVVCKGKVVIEPPVTSNDEIKFIDDEATIDFSKAIESNSLINEGILIANEGGNLEIGEKIKIIAHILPYSIMETNPYVIRSSNENVIMIGKGKVIEAVGVGEAIITAYSLDGKYKDSINYTVKESQVRVILASEIYNLEISRFNIVANNNSESIAIENSLGINAALKFCTRYGYKRIVFPQNLLIYIEPKISIYMVSNLLVDLNGSELKLRANNYERYGAINFKEGNINLLKSFDISDKVVGTFLNTKNVIKTTIKDNMSFYSCSIKVRNEKLKDDYDQSLDYFLYGDKVDLYLQIARNIINADSSKSPSASGVIYVDYFKDNNLVTTVKIRDVWLSSATAAYFTNNNVSFQLREVNDYNLIKIRIGWTLNNSTAEVYIGEISLSKEVASVLTNAKLMNGIITGERDEKSTVYPNWFSVDSTEGGVSIIFSEGYKNGIENLTIRKSIGFNMSSQLGKDSYGVVNYSQYPISCKMMELGSLNSLGENINCNDLIRTIDYIDISKISTPYYDIGYSLGYMGYPYVTCRIYDICFYDVNKNFIRKYRGRLTFRRYNKPENAYYVKVVFYSNVVPTSGNSDFNGAFAFIENFEYPIKNYIKNCIIEDNYSCGFAACGGQQWRIENNTWRRNAGRMPGCDIDWEDGWEYMQEDLVEGNSFESYSNVILCAGLGQIYKHNKFNGLTTVYGRSQYWSFIDNNIEDSVSITNGNGARLSLLSSTDVYLEGNSYNKSSVVWSPNHGSSARYDIYIKNESFNSSNILSGRVRNVRNSSFTGDNFVLNSLMVTNCVFNGGLITTNTSFNSCNIKSMTIRPAKDSNIIIQDSYLYNSKISPSVQANDVTINKCIISKDIVGQLMEVSSNSTGGLVVNNSTLKFNSLTDYYYIIGGWNANECIAIYTFNNCIIETQKGFKGYLIKCTWYPISTDVRHLTLNFNNTNVSMFEKTDSRGLNSNVVINIK